MNMIIIKRITRKKKDVCYLEEKKLFPTKQCFIFLAILYTAKKSFCNKISKF